MKCAARGAATAYARAAAFDRLPDIRICAASADDDVIRLEAKFYIFVRGGAPSARLSFRIA